MYLKEHITVTTLVASRYVLKPLEKLAISSTNISGASNEGPWATFPLGGTTAIMGGNSKTPVTCTATGCKHHQCPPEPRGYLLSCLPKALQDWVTLQNDHPYLCKQLWSCKQRRMKKTSLKWINPQHRHKLAATH